MNEKQFYLDALFQSLMDASAAASILDKEELSSYLMQRAVDCIEEGAKA